MDNMLQVVLVTILFTVAIMTIAITYYNAKKANKNESFEELFPDIWAKIRSILSELFINIFNLYDASNGGFDGMLKFAVDYIQKKIDEAGVLTEQERKLITDDFIILMIKPTLLELYNQKIKE